MNDHFCLQITCTVWDGVNLFITNYMSKYPISGAGTTFPSWRTWVYSRLFLCHTYFAQSLLFFKKNTLNIFYCQQLYKQWMRNKLSTYEVFFVTYKSLKRQYITNTIVFCVSTIVCRFVFYIWSLCCLSILDLRFLITPLVSLNISFIIHLVYI